jgi:hypothetical protein
MQAIWNWFKRQGTATRLALLLAPALCACCALTLLVPSGPPASPPEDQVRTAAMLYLTELAGSGTPTATITSIPSPTFAPSATLVPSATDIPTNTPAPEPVRLQTKWDTKSTFAVETFQPGWDYTFAV